MTTLKIISIILLALTGLYILWVVLVAIMGFFIKKEPYPVADHHLRFAVVICARNEETVIGNLIESLKAQHYPNDCFRIFVVAHNCSDRTAEIAKEHGALVYVRNAPIETHKGDALHHGLERIQQDYPKSFEAFSVLDADNLAGHDYLSEMNNALCAGADVVQGFRAIKNFDENLLTRLFGFLWMAMAYAQNIPHTALHLPVIISGTGFSAMFDALPKTGWQTQTLCEDIEFSAQQTLLGHRIAAAAKARFYDEQPVKLKDGFNQRFRWAVGINQCFLAYAAKLFRAIPKRGIAAFKVLLDVSLNPVLITGIIGAVMLTVSLRFSGVSARTLWLCLAGLILFGWLCVLPMSVNMIIKEKLPFFENLGAMMLLPAFLFFSGLLALIVPFCKNVTWRQIPHSNATTLEEIEKQVENEKQNE